MSEVVTVRIDPKTKQKIKKHGINVSQTVRKALQKEIAKKEEENLRSALSDASRILQKVSEREIVKSVRESRDQR